MDHTLRYLAPVIHDRVFTLLKQSCFKHPTIIPQLQLLKIIKDPIRYIEYLERIECLVAIHEGVNLIITNIPKQAQYSHNGETTRVGYEEIRDTIEAHGDVQYFRIVNGGSVYIKYDDPLDCYNRINNMQMGENILHCRLVC